MCAGNDFSGTFQKCTFQSCSLYVVHDASATVSDCTFCDRLAGLIAHGSGTTATVTRCVFHDCRSCIIAEAGASVAVRSSALSSGLGAIVVNHPGSGVTADDCAMHGTICALSGLRVVDGSACLRRCILQNFSTAVIIKGSQSLLELHEGRITDCMSGVDVQGSARCTLANVSVNCSKDPDEGMRPGAVILEAKQARRPCIHLQATRCDLLHPHREAVIVATGGSAALSLCRLDSRMGAVLLGPGASRGAITHCECTSEGISYLAQSPEARLRVTGGTTVAAKAACAAVDGAALTVADGRLTGGCTDMEYGPVELLHYHGAVALRSGATGTLLRCVIRDSLVGMSAKGGACARVTDTNFLDLMSCPPGMPDYPSAAFYCCGSRLEVQGGVVRNCWVGVDARGDDDVTVDESASVRLCGVAFEQFTRGLDICKGCEAEVTGCRFEGFAGIDPRNFTPKFVRAGGPGSEAPVNTVGLGFMKCKRAVVRGCSLRGSDIQVIAASEESLHIQECEFHGLRGPRRYGVAVQVFARTVIEDCQFTGDDTGVFASAAEADASCEVRRCKFGGGGMSTAIEAAEGARITVVSTEIRDVRSGMFVFTRAAIAAQDCVCEVSDTALGVGTGGGTLTGKRVTVRGGEWGLFASRLLSTSCGPGMGAPGRAKVKLVDCALQGERQAVNASGENVDVAMMSCELHSPAAAVAATDGAAVRLRKSSVRGGLAGVMVGDAPEDLRGPCASCGRAGEEAKLHAWRAMLADAESGGGRDVHGVRCAHDGARAQVTLDAVAIRECTHAGVSVMPHGLLRAQGVHVSAITVGFRVVGLSGLEANSFRGCSVAPPPGLKGMLCIPVLASSVEMTEPGHGKGFRVTDGLSVEGVVTAAGSDSE